MRYFGKIYIFKINKDILKKIVSYPLLLLLAFTLSISAQNNINECSTVYEVTAAQLNIRDNPNTSGEIVGKLNKYDNVCVTEVSGNWAQIENGWVSGKFIKAVANNKVTEHQMIVETVNDVDDTTEKIVYSGNNHLETESHQNIKNTNRSSSWYGFIGLVVGVIMIAFIGFFLYNFFIHSLIALKLAEPDGRKKMGIRSTLLGRFVQGLLVFLLFLLFMMIGSISQ